MRALFYHLPVCGGGAWPCSRFQSGGVGGRRRGWRWIRFVLLLYSPSLEADITNEILGGRRVVGGAVASRTVVQATHSLAGALVRFFARLRAGRRCVVAQYLCARHRTDIDLLAQRRVG